MTYKYSWVGVLFFLLIGVVSGYSGAYTYIDINEIDLGPKLNILNGYKRGVDTDVSCQEELVFELTLTNSKDYWVHWDNLKCNLKIIHPGDEQNYDLTQTLSGKNCLPPKKEINVWIPFETYNELEEEERLGHWTIIPDVSLDGVSCFFSVDITKDICSSGLYGKRTSSFSGNEKEINVVKKEPSIHTTFEEIKKVGEGIYNFITPLGSLATAIVAILTLVYFFKGRSRKGGKIRKK